ncbi:universal stress protein [Cellulomonas sp. C5510]|uniref:universal stress protein n=1 Tax=Cellulomonas sp. C5510 TaxID=2871170 RepID=UPI001C97B585|nr:universal stress protein [Cellulomonas sp. C5510]QZN86983.1 universal stress protein [Cellulomonas sp. C5510]
MGHEVVVGVDGTQSSRRAVQWGAQEAWARRTELVLVHATGRPSPGLESAWDSMLDAEVAAMLDREAARARHDLPELKIRTEVDADTPARCLTRRSATARLVVVGTRRMTAAERVFTGSLAYQVVAGSHCSVAVVPPVTGPAENRVVVGADGSPDSVAAVRAGAEQADRAGAVLEVVHAWQEPAVTMTATWLPPDLSDVTREEEQVVLAEASAGLGADFPDLEVERTLVRAQPAAALLAASASALLLVVGSRGLHGVARMLLGSTSHAVVLHSPCPVLVVRR